MTQKVPFTPPQTKSGKCKIAILGEAPGREEAEQLEGFVGNAGKLLDYMLGEAGIDRSVCMIGNIFRIRPTNNQIMEFFVSNKVAKEQEIEIRDDLPSFNGKYMIKDYESELKHLRKMLKKYRPKIVLATGNTPLWALAGGGKITQLHGQLMPCTLWENCVVMPIYHPSYVARGRTTRIPETVEDLKKAKKLSKKKRQVLLNKVA